MSDEKFVSHSLRYTIRKRDVEDDAVWGRPMYVRFGWAYHGLRDLSHRLGFHDWLVSRRWYLWWGNQRYGPTVAQSLVKSMRDAQDAALAARYTDLFK